jgi:hypothetical protein
VDKFCDDFSGIVCRAQRFLLDFMIDLYFRVARCIVNMVASFYSMAVLPSLITRLDSGAMLMRISANAANDVSSRVAPYTWACFPIHCKA